MASYHKEKQQLQMMQQLWVSGVSSASTSGNLSEQPKQQVPQVTGQQQIELLQKQPGQQQLHNMPQSRGMIQSQPQLQMSSILQGQAIMQPQQQSQRGVLLSISRTILLNIYKLCT